MQSHWYLCGCLINLSSPKDLYTCSVIGDDSVCGGECMSVVTDKLVWELQTELDAIKNTWTEPVTHAAVVKNLEKATKEKENLEVRN